jgi:hypothetical protein
VKGAVKILDLPLVLYVAACALGEMFVFSNMTVLKGETNGGWINNRMD